MPRQLRCRSAGAREAKHAAAPVASGTYALESIKLVAGQRIVGTPAKGERAVACWACRRIGRLASIRKNVATGHVHTGIVRGGDPVKGAVAFDQRPGPIELSFIVFATRLSETFHLPVLIDEIGKPCACANTKVRVTARYIGMHVRPDNDIGDFDPPIPVLGHGIVGAVGRNLGRLDRE